MFISTTELAPIKELYNRGLYLQAFDRALQLGPLAQWEGTDARLLAGRLAIMLGAPKLARKLHLRAWRDDPQHAEAIYYYTRAVWDWRGPWRAWLFARQFDELPNADALMQADWFGLKAALFGLLRDFDTADELIARAESLCADNPWVWVEKSSLLEQEDRYDEALKAAEYALQLRPWYRPALQSVGHLLSLLDREADALDLLRQASPQIECAAISAQLAQLQMDAGDYQAARDNFERAVELSPLLEEDSLDWYNGRRADAAYLCGDFATALKFGERLDNGFFKVVTERLRNATAEQRRVQLPVGFIRQHHVTCAPATLTTISRFWRKPAEHLNIAEQICYGGTADHSERKWAEQNGWVAREFCINLPDAKKLIERGVPFTMATVDPGNAHLQAVIGFDELRGTLLLRDPYLRSLGEALAEELISHYQSTGPRGMALVPQERAELLADLDLQEAALYDELHAIQHALFNHRRADAFDIWQTMSRTAADHRLTLNARLVLAWYDEDYEQVLANVEKLLAAFPNDANLKLQKVSVLRALARRSERLDYLKAICEDEKSDPLFWQQLAGELSEDAREQRTVFRLLHRSLRSRPLEAGTFWQLANLRWAQRHFDEALELYRFAACLRDTNEQYVQSYFIAARHLRKTQDALKFLAQRFHRFGKRSGFPIRTLSWAYEQTGQSTQALATLQQGLAWRPEDGELLLFASDVFARHGDFAQAAELLARAQGRAPQTQWLRGAALVAAYRGELREALALWRQVVDAEPLALDANRNVAQLLAETESQEQALDFLRDATRRFPHSLPLHQLLVDWLRDDAVEAEAVLRHVIEIEPTNAWARRELTYKLCQQQKYEDAFEEAALGRELEPDNPYGQCAIGTVHAELGNFLLARQAFREAIKLSVDNEYAVGELMNNSHTVEERRESLEFIRQELYRQVTFGDGLFAYRQAARATLDAEEVLPLLQAGLDARPDLWHAWSVMVHQLVDLQRLDDALQLARQMTERFPLTPRVWLDLAYVYQVRLDENGVIEALTHARRINPAWSVATQQLTEAYQRAGEFAKARELMEQAIAYAPLDYTNYGYLADVLWQMNEREQAVERIEHALTLEPGYDWGWRILRDWTQKWGKPERAVEFARALAEKKPGQARSWLILAQTEGQSLEERLNAVERALQLNPQLLDAHTLRARLLTMLMRYDEARAACRPEIYGETLPPELRCAEACVDADRGDLPAAIKQLEELTAVEPNYFQAWNLLADWHRGMQSNSAYLKAAQEMVRLAPYRPVPLGYLADAQLCCEDIPAAKETLRRALTLDPAYEFAGVTLFDLQLQGSDLDGAAETLNILRQQIGGDAATVRELKLAGKRQDFAAARALFRQLCLSRHSDGKFIAQAIDAEIEGDWQNTVDSVLDEVLDLPDANPNVGAIWVERREVRKEWSGIRQRLDAMPERGALWQQAAIAFMDALIKAKEKHLLRQFIAAEREPLRAAVVTWANVGYALLSIGDKRDTLEWLSDWRARQELEPWMLWNLSLALREEGRDLESYEVSKHSLGLPPSELSQAHALFVIYEEMMQGNWQSANQRLAKINEPTLRDWDRHLWRMINTWQEHQQAGASGLPTHAEAVRRLLRLSSESNYFDGSSVLFKMMRRLALKLAEERGSLLFSAVVRIRLWGVSFLRSIVGKGD